MHLTDCVFCILQEKHINQLVCRNIYKAAKRESVQNPDLKTIKFCYLCSKKFIHSSFGYCLLLQLRMLTKSCFMLSMAFFILSKKPTKQLFISLLKIKVDDLTIFLTKTQCRKTLKCWCFCHAFGHHFMSGSAIFM